MRNPKWHRDEIILALDLYFDSSRGSIDANNPKVIALSEILNRLPIYSIKPNEDNFRNPNGVSLKLSNFLAIDPKFKGKGMSRGSKLDKIIFDQFCYDHEGLRQIARKIKSIVANELLTEKLAQIENDESLVEDFVREGQVLYRLHKYKERNVRIVNAKKKIVFNATGQLVCEVCKFDFFKTYGQRGLGFIECHHIQPISISDTEIETKLSDLALVCSNCHRMLHRNASLLTIDELKKELINS